ncbi:ArsA family ATPase [Spongisporangium articulatum]|uniref:ArsA family ATPase n=1 Tax=Spongisporangium articulatum TaxID=3362603 RepID=A0ABW8ASY6_9ACTN
MTRLLLFTGKGGVGKTSTAAATAAHAAASGLRTLVMSADPAHSLGDALATPLGPTPRAVGERLHAQQVDTRSHPDGDWERLERYLVELLADVGVDPIAARELAELPGVEDVFTLLEVRRQASVEGWDLIVVDCGPSAETLRLLAVAEVYERLLARLLPMERRIARVVGAVRKAGVLPTGDRLAEAADRLAAQLAGIHELLTAPTTSVRLVMTPETVVLAETRRTWTALGVHGFPVDGVVVNRVLEPDASDPWRSRWGRAHAEVLARARESFAPTPVAVVGYDAAEPVGPEPLLQMASQLYGEPGERAARRLLEPVRRTQPFEVARDDEGFTLSLPMPLAERSELDLGRRGDELVVGVGGSVRVITLPGALRRCQVDGARLRDGTLDVRFVPDPRYWRSV